MTIGSRDRAILHGAGSLVVVVISRLAAPDQCCAIACGKERAIKRAAWEVIAQVPAGTREETRH
jgi:hypothetical protein